MTSTIKVDNIQDQDGNNIINENSNTITIGASGDTVTLASGASQSGFGRTGTVDWQTGSIKTATFTAVSGEGYFCNTGGGAFTMNLPAGSAGAIVSVQDYNNTFATHNLTIDPNGSEKINGGDAGATIKLNTTAQGLTLVYIDSTIGWRSVQDNTYSTVGGSFLEATGGTESTCGDYKIHTFTGPGTFTVPAVSTCAARNVVDYLVVAGGGSAPATNGGDGISGGGGGGGFRYFANPSTNPQSGNPGSPLNAPAGLTLTATSFPIAVGGGGPAGTGPTGWAPGVNSTFSTITATGGGRGGRGDPTDPGGCAGGQPGGSGGGGDNGPSAAGNGNTPPVSPAQGNNGGAGGNSSAGGGGGATAAGTAGSTNGGPGGNGAGITGFGSSNGQCSSNIQYFSGGGGGANGNANYPSPGTVGTGGLGGGANGKNPSCVSASNGTANTGGGGGGASDKNPGGGAGGAGGSGIVVIRYKYQ